MFALKTYKSKTVFVINNSVITDEITELILKNIKNNKKIAIDMSGVNSIESKKFIECLIDDKFKLFNLQNEVLIYLALVVKDGFLKSYMMIDDLFENKRELIRRRFLVA